MVRNPWARMFSLFQHTMLRVDQNRPNQLVNNLELDIRSRYSMLFKTKSANEMQRIGVDNMRECFEFWLFFIGRNKQLLPAGNPNFNILPQSWWFLEKNVLKRNIRLFQYEKITELENFMGINCQKTNVSRYQSNSNYIPFYNDNTAEYVYNLDKWVIDKFNYKFQ